MKILRIEVEGETLPVTGGDFYEILEQVKNIQGRKWDGDRKVWKLPGTLKQVRAALPVLVIGEDEVIDAESVQIEELLDWFAENSEEVQEYIQKRERWITHAKSSIKAKYATEKRCLQNSLNFAKVWALNLTEQQIITLKKARRIVEENEE